METAPMKLFVLLWLIMISRVFGAWIGGRQCLRLRYLTKSRVLYEWLTGLGVGFIIWGIADFGLVWNSIVNPSTPSSLTSLWFSIGFHLLKTLGIWTVTLIILNGSSPGPLRTAIFWVFELCNIMESKKEFSRHDKVKEDIEQHDTRT